MYVEHLLIITVTTNRLDKMREDKLTTTVPAQPTQHSVLHQNFDFDELTILYRANAHWLSRHVCSPLSSETPAQHDRNIFERVVPLSLGASYGDDR